GGSGGSSSDPLESFNEDALAVMNAVGSDQAAYVGWSVAANLITTFAATHPELVEALVFINSCAHYVREDDYPWGYPRERLSDSAAFIEESWSTMAAIGTTAPSRMKDERLNVVWGRGRRSGINPYEYAENLRRLFESDTRSLLPSISAPTLVLHREGD